MPISNRSPLRHNPRLTVGYRGLNFTRPGPYRIWVEFDIGTSRRPKVVTSNVVEFELMLPRDGIEAVISQTLSDPSISYFVAHKGGGLPRSKRRRLQELAKVYPRQQSVQHVRYALGFYYLKRGRRAEAKAILRGVRPCEDSLQQHLGEILEDL